MYGIFTFYVVIFEWEITRPALVFNSLKAVFIKGPSFHFWKSILRLFELHAMFLVILV